LVHVARVDGKRAFGLGTPGAMRDELTSLVLSGDKTATAGLWKDEYEPQSEAIDHVGEQQVLLDSSDEAVAIVEITRVESHRFDSVPWEFAQAEGEGFQSIEEWRDGHRSYYEAQGVPVDDTDLVVCVWLQVLERVGV
jgi:uncharacterized protein YhfF